jgi:hypothetical protein
LKAFTPEFLSYQFELLDGARSQEVPKNEMPEHQIRHRDTLPNQAPKRLSILLIPGILDDPERGLSVV